MATVVCAGALVAGPAPAGAGTRATRHRAGHAVGISGPEWDPKIAPIAAEVENLRNLKFKHSVPIHYLDDAKFQQRFLGKDTPPSAAAAAAFQREEEQLRALGLLDKDIDLRAMSRQTLSTNALAFYDPRDKQVFVRGTDTLAPATRVTLAHELTHALQDQHFNLLQVQRRALHGSPSTVKAIIEGDATFVQHAFVSVLSPELQQASEQVDAAEAAQARTEDVPELLKVRLGAPYALGDQLVSLVHAAEGSGGVDELFRHPPFTDLALVDPTTVLDGPRLVFVGSPKLAAGEKRVGQVVRLGAFGLYTVLASRLPAADAMRAADLWRGDSMLTFERDGRTCVRVDLQGADDAATAEIRSALDAWTAARSGSGAAATTVAQTRAEVTSCAPVGATAPMPAGTLLTATQMIVERNALMSGLLKGPGSEAQARCVATGLIAIPGVQNVFEQVDGGTLTTAAGKAEIGQVVSANRSAILSSCQ